MLKLFSSGASLAQWSHRRSELLSVVMRMREAQGNGRGLLEWKGDCMPLSETPRFGGRSSGKLCWIIVGRVCSWQ